MNHQEAVGNAILALKAGEASQYGYDYYSHKVARWVADRETKNGQEAANLAVEYTPFFEEAGWTLSLRGLLRPGVRSFRAQAVEEGGYSLTSNAANQLAELDEFDVLVFQSGALSETFHGYVDKFGESFAQRAIEAIACRDSSAWLACCVMSGAAAEVILLSIAEAKVGDRDQVLDAYRRAHGRQNILNLIIGQAPEHRRRTLTAFAGIISIWRDEAGHGAATSINTANADEALRQLLHMCQWVSKEWEALVQ